MTDIDPQPGVPVSDRETNGSSPKYSAPFTLPTECEWPTFEAGPGSARLVCVEQIVLTGGQLLLLG